LVQSAHFNGPVPAELSCYVICPRFVRPLSSVPLISDL
jgi:hypothetical protein